MAFTKADLEKIERAMAMGELSVEIEGHKVTYRNVDDLIKAHDVIERQINSASVQSTSTYASFCDD